MGRKGRVKAGSKGRLADAERLVIRSAEIAAKRIKEGCSPFGYDYLTWERRLVNSVAALAKARKERGES